MKKIEDFFNSIKDKEIKLYNDYWGELKPQSINAMFRRYLFSFMSIRATWKKNCAGYNSIKKFNKWRLEKADQLFLWDYNHDELLALIKKSQVGIQNNRTKFIGDFSDAFWSNIKTYTCKDEQESWGTWRDKLCNKIKGLGKAKTSFAIEMMFPLEAQVVCMDTHMFKAYNLDQHKDFKLYNIIENDWLNRCERRGVAPYIARSIYWDRNQNRRNSRYWSKVLES